MDESTPGSMVAARARDDLTIEREELERSRSDYLSMLAHELSGPLTSVKGFGEHLRDNWDTMDAQQRGRVLDIITSEIDRLARLSTDLLDAARMEAGTMGFRRKAVSVPEVLQSILTLHASLSRHHTVESRIADSLPKVVADKDRVCQVFLNLLTNATRYSAEGTTITVGADAEDKDSGRVVRIFVRDEGIGIETDDLERIFEKFSTLPKPAWASKGTGLGLYITKQIVDALGGNIWAESKPGGGTTFFFTLPAAE